MALNVNDVGAVIRLMMQQLVAGYIPSDDIVDWVYLEQEARGTGDGSGWLRPAPSALTAGDDGAKGGLRGPDRSQMVIGLAGREMAAGRWETGRGIAVWSTPPSILVDPLSATSSKASTS